MAIQINLLEWKDRKDFDRKDQIQDERQRQTEIPLNGNRTEWEGKEVQESWWDHTGEHTKESSDKR